MTMRQTMRDAYVEFCAEQNIQVNTNDWMFFVAGAVAGARIANNAYDEALKTLGPPP